MEPRRLWRRWLVIVAAGEIVGFVVPVIAGIWSSDLAPALQLTALCAAGLAEGACLGASQAFVLRDPLPVLRPRRWVLATSLAAGAAWFLGMLPSTTQALWSTWPRASVLVIGGLLGGALLASIGTAQALVLPRRLGGRWAWVGWTALGWGAGLTAFTMLATPLWHEGQARWVTIVVGVGAGVVMAVTMSAVTGVGAVRLARRLRSVEGAVEPARADPLRAAGWSRPV